MKAEIVLNAWFSAEENVIGTANKAHRMLFLPETILRSLSPQHFLKYYNIVRKIRPPGELIRKDKLVEISGGKCVAADVSKAAAAIIKANDARGVAVTSA